MYAAISYSRLEPIDKLDNMWVLHALQHLEFVVNHLLIALDILLEDNLDGDLSRRAIGLSDDSICAGSQRSPKSILGPTERSACKDTEGVGRLLLIVTLWLAMELVEHIRD